MKKIPLTLICALSAIMFSVCRTNTISQYNVDSAEQAMIKISEEEFQNECFGDITEKELIEYQALPTDGILTECGNIYAYELHYKLKTDNPRFLAEEKISTDPFDINEWLPAMGVQYIAIFENDGIYYELDNMSDLMYNISQGNFYYLNEDYANSSSCARDLLEYRIIKSILKNENIPNLKLSDASECRGILRKFINDINCNVKTDYNIDMSSSRVYNFSYDKEIDCIYFKADLYADDGRIVAENMGFSMFYFQSGGEIENLPKQL